MGDRAVGMKVGAREDRSLPFGGISTYSGVLRLATEGNQAYRPTFQPSAREGAYGLARVATTGWRGGHRPAPHRGKRRGMSWRRRKDLPLWRA